MKINVLFFGMLADKAGNKKVSIEIDKPNATVADVISTVREKIKTLPEGKFLLAVNEEQAEPSTSISDKDEVAIMPPFSGG